MADFDVSAVIIGAGVVGLAVANELASRGIEPLVIERHPGAGRETSSRNSGVIHAGIYYERDSKKANYCVRGNALLYEFCQRHRVDHKRIGKMILATSDDQIERLEGIYQHGSTNGARDLEIIDEKRIKRLEPRVHALAGIWSPSSGIVDQHEFVKALEGCVGAKGGQVLYHHRLARADKLKEGFRLTISGPKGDESVNTPLVINAAGLDSDKVASILGDDRWQLYWCRGDYFRLPPSASKGIAHLLYPLPTQHGLGIHATINMGGQVIFGPDTTYVERQEQQPDVDPDKATLFLEAATRYLPDLKDVSLSPDMWGMRPKLQAPGDDPVDFVVEIDPHGVVHLVGIESPGLTASLAIAEDVGIQLENLGAI